MCIIHKWTEEEVIYINETYYEGISKEPKTREKEMFRKMCLKCGKIKIRKAMWSM